MDWLNLHVSTLNSEALLRSEPVDRATWLFLLHYCIVQENGGVVRDARSWSDRTWQQLCRVTKEEVERSCGLWTWDGDNLAVTAYPLDKEREVQSKRTGGVRGGMAKSPAKAEAARKNGTQAQPKLGPKLNPSSTQAGTQRKGKEGKGKELERETEPPPERGALSLQATAWKRESIEEARIKQREEAIAFLQEIEEAACLTNYDPTALDNLRKAIAFNGPGSPPIGGPVGPLAILKRSFKEAVSETQAG